MKLFLLFTYYSLEERSDRPFTHLQLAEKKEMIPAGKRQCSGLPRYHYRPEVAWIPKQYIT